MMRVFDTNAYSTVLLAASVGIVRKKAACSFVRGCLFFDTHYLTEFLRASWGQEG